MCGEGRREAASAGREARDQPRNELQVGKGWGASPIAQVEDLCKGSGDNKEVWTGHIGSSEARDGSIQCKSAASASRVGFVWHEHPVDRANGLTVTIDSQEYRVFAVDSKACWGDQWLDRLTLQRAAGDIVSENLAWVAKACDHPAKRAWCK